MNVTRLWRLGAVTGLGMIAAIWLTIVSCSARNVTPTANVPEFIKIKVVRELVTDHTAESLKLVDETAPRDFSLQHELTKEGNNFRLKLNWSSSGPKPDQWYVMCEWEQVAPKDHPRKFLRGDDCGGTVKTTSFTSDLLEPGTEYDYSIYVRVPDDKAKNVKGGTVHFVWLSVNLKSLVPPSP